MGKLSTIQKFYDGKTIFITGGTGLVGKCLVEKLLRSCFVKNIILLVRPRGSQSFEERTTDYFSDVIFTKLKSNDPSSINKVTFVNGDIALAKFGLSANHSKMIAEQTDVVFNAAATVKFRTPLHEIVPLNLIATKTIIEFAKEMKNMQALVHVSTTYAFCNENKLDETIPEVVCTPELLMALVKHTKKDVLDKITPMFLGKVLNTYLLTKQAAESLIEEAHPHIPVSVYRPASVSQTYREPIPGWANHRFGTIGMALGIGTGATKILNAPINNRLDVVPVDMVANCMIAVAWNTAVHRDNELRIYNHFTEDNPIYRQQFFGAFVKSRYPLESAFRYPGYKLVKSGWLYRLCVPFVTTVPNKILDMVYRMFGNKSIYEQNRRLISTMEVVKHYSVTNFNFETKNIPALWNKLDADDKKLFNFDSQSICWDTYKDACARGLKEILLKEDMSKLDKVKFKHALLRCYEYLITISYTVPIMGIPYLVYTSVF